MSPPEVRERKERKGKWERKEERGGGGEERRRERSVLEER